MEGHRWRETMKKRWRQWVGKSGVASVDLILHVTVPSGERLPTEPTRSSDGPIYTASSRRVLAPSVGTTAGNIYVLVTACTRIAVVMCYLRHTSPLV